MDISKEKAIELFIDFLQLDWVGRNIAGQMGDTYDCTDYVPYNARNRSTSTDEKVAWYTTQEMLFCTDITWLNPMIEFIESLDFGTELIYVPGMGHRLQFYKKGITCVQSN